MATCGFTLVSLSLLPVANVVPSPFLQFVSDTESFDNQIASYVRTQYVREKYVYGFWLHLADV